LAYSISYKSSVKRDLKKLSNADAARVLNQLEDDPGKNPLNYPARKGEFTGLRKYRVGDYRVIYAVLDGAVLVLRIGNRKDVYR